MTCPATTLAVGASMTCTGTGVAIAGQYRNVGTVTGTSPSGAPVTANDPDHYYGTTMSISSNLPCAFRTQTQGGWGSTPSGNNPGTLLEEFFPALFYDAGSASIRLVVGVGNTLTFTSAAAIRAFLPQDGTARALSTRPSSSTHACAANVPPSSETPSRRSAP